MLDTFITSGKGDIDRCTEDYNQACTLIRSKPPARGRDMSISPTLDQFRGCLLGQAVADGFGAPFEGLTSEIIFHEFGRISELIKNPPVDILYYTDDTQMAIGIAETLIECDNIDEEYLVRAFAKNYYEKRGYGQGVTGDLWLRIFFPVDRTEMARPCALPLSACIIVTI